MRFRSPSLPALAALALLLGTGCATSRPAPDDDTDPDTRPAESGTSSGDDALSTDLSERRPQPDAIQAPPAYERAVEQGTRTEDGRPGPNYWVNRPTYDLDVALQPEGGPDGAPYLDGRARIRYQNNSPDTLGALVLELAQNHHKKGVQRNESTMVTGGVDIERLVANGTALEADAQSRPTYSVSDTRLFVALAEPLLPGETASLDVEYGFVVPEQGISSRMGYSGEELYGQTNLYYIGYFYPQVSVYDDVRFREDQGGWMEDRYLGRAEYYSDHGSYDLSITAPAAWTVQSTGTLENPREVLRGEVRQRRQEAYQSGEPTTILEPGERATPETDTETLTWEYRAENVRDVAFSVMRGGDWHWEGARTPVGDRSGDGQTDSTRINSFWRPKAPLWSEMTRYQQHSITHHSRFTGLEYPWPHMSAVEGMGIIGGGMEFPMMTLMGGYNDGGAGDLYNVTAHELAHMWIPMTLSTNERRFAWIDEGATVFNEAAARKDFFPDNGTRPHVADARSYIQGALAGVEAPLMRWSDYHYTSASYGVASYPKPAALWHALRGIMGAEDFRQAYEDFYDAWAFKHPTPYDLFSFFEAAHGEGLGWFWDSFYDETWTLDQAVQSVENTDGGVRVTVRDRGNAVMPVDLTVTLANGDTLQHRVPVDPWLRGQRTTTATIQANATAERVEIDAARYYPDTDRNNNVWTR